MLVVDPPEGWKYGFPKPYPVDLPWSETAKWFINQGYPRHLVEQHMLQYCRFWEVSDTNDPTS